ncbi:hypothetical protein B0919_19015 [Hymenobacter sp. CRA2]|nr:hypothetical protein B0919_19015 [Hymenobacter sp. CRA2]
MVQKVAADAAGNGYVAGRFSRQVRFGAFELKSTGSSDVFVAKVSADGQWQWAVSAGGDGADIASGIEVDPQGNVIVTGSFAATARFGALTRSSQGSLDMFVGVLSPSGQWQSVTTAGGEEQDQILDLAMDAHHNIYVAGRFRGTASFGTTTLQSQAASDAFIAKLTPQGEWAWASQTNGDDQTVIQGLAVDEAGSVYAAGYFGGGTRFGSTTLTSAGTHDAFVAKTTAAGQWQWATAGGGASTDYAHAVAVGADGNVFVTGSFSGRASLGTNELVSRGGSDAYVARLNKTGRWDWVYTLSGSALEEGTGICLGAGGSIYISGHFSRGAQYGSISLASKGSTDVFVARLTRSGRWLDFLSAGSTATDEANSIKPSPSGDLFVGGTVGAATSFGANSVDEVTPQVFIGRAMFPARMTADIY